MRQIGTLTTADDAQRFAAYLVTQQIGAVAEPDNNAWAIWIKDEDKLEKAREALEQFRANPQDPRYANAAQKAAELQREQQQRQAAAKKNVVEMRGHWKAGPGGRGGSIFRAAPLTCVLIGLSLFLSLVPQFNTVSPTYLTMRLGLPTNVSMADGTFDPFAEVKQGQLWRLVTPIFLHGSPMHLIFDMWMLYVLGRMVEERYGAWRMALMVLVMAVVANCTSALMNEYPGIGMSGVVYGLFGFVWMKMHFDPQPGFNLSPGTIFLALVWLFGSMAAKAPPLDKMFGALQNIDDAAHFGGLAIGMILATAPLLIKRRA